MKISGRSAADIAESIERHLRTGKCGPGEALPTVRGLAATLGVSPATVAAAYKLLRARGLVAGRGRRGTRVAPGPGSAVLVAAPATPRGAIDLASGNPDPALLPPIGPAFRTVEEDVPLYGGRSEHKGLLTFTRSEFEEDGVPAKALAVVSGAMDGIERTLHEHLRPGDRVALEDPSFPGLIDLISASGFAAVPFATDEEGPLPDSLAAAVKQGIGALIVTPRAQNPTGAAVSAARASELKRILRERTEILLIENDYAAPVAGMPFCSLRGDSHARWVVIRSTSKFLGPDLRVALVAGDDLTVSRICGRQALGARWVSHILQQLALALWSDPASGRRLARSAEIYAQRRMAALAAVHERGIEARGVSGFNIWIPVRDEGGVVGTLADRGWAVAAGERFRIESDPGIRVTVSTLQPTDASRFADDLASALRAPHRSSA